MKCGICNSQNISDKTVDEEIKLDNDIVIVSINTLVCESCGERYYNRQTMKTLEYIEEKLHANAVKLNVVGAVLKLDNQLGDIQNA